LFCLLKQIIGRLSADADNRPMPIVKWPIPIIGKLADSRPMPIIGKLAGNRPMPIIGL